MSEASNFSNLVALFFNPLQCFRPRPHHPVVSSDSEIVRKNPVERCHIASQIRLDHLIQYVADLFLGIAALGEPNGGRQNSASKVRSSLRRFINIPSL